MAHEGFEAIVLCGGLGRRLRSAVSDRPKCLAPVGGRPFLEFVLLQLRSFGIHDVILCVGYRSEQVREYFGTGERWGLALDYSFEDVALGTAGALKGAQAKVRHSPFMTLNGDSILEFRLDRLLDLHEARGALATLALARVSSAGRYGSVLADDSGQITAFCEKGNSSDGTSLINAGVYVFSRAIFDSIPAAPPAVSLETGIFPRLVGQRLYGYLFDGYFVDIGIPQDYDKAQRELPGRDKLC
jgi:NDP-sugar pyrophosphorylase family protein